MPIEQRGDSWVTITRSPESYGIVPGALVSICDYVTGWHLTTVKVVEVADSHLIGVQATETVIDRGSGELYPAGVEFTAWHLDGKLYFIPTDDDEE